MMPKQPHPPELDDRDRRPQDPAITARELDNQALDLGRLRVLMWRAIRLRCPNCGNGGIFVDWFTLRPACPHCGIRLDRGENDYFLGAYLFNLIAVEIILFGILAAVVLLTLPNPPWTALQYGAAAAVSVGAFVCYPFAKTTWLAVDLALRPMTPEELAWHRRGGHPGETNLPQL
jgi:uncharacterized protein (DUF983 family)